MKGSILSRHQASLASDFFELSFKYLVVAFRKVRFGGSFCSLPESEERDARSPRALIRIRTIDLFRSYIIIVSVDADLFEWYG